MQEGRQTTRMIHDDHVASIGLLNELETLLSRNKSSGPAPSGPGLANFLRSLASNLERDVTRHFDFEQGRLFPLLGDGGDSDIALLLTDEHDGIRDVATRLAAAANAARENGFAQGWKEFHQLSREYIERQISHIQKEEMALLPMLEDLLDEETDAELSQAYAETR